MAVEPIIIDFQVNSEELITAQEQLAKAGKVDTKQFEALNKSLTKSATDTKGLIQQFKQVSNTATAMGKSVKDAFNQGVADALDEAGVSAEEFADALAKANAPSKSLKQELKDLKERMAQLKLEGKDTGAEFVALRSRAGELSDAIADAGAEIKNAGSDTRGLDNVVGSVSAIAGGFAAAQGAAALFGTENEDIQKTLLKVNATIAVASGIQQFYNATLKEGSLAKLADSTATGIQTATQRLYTLATGKATAATVAFKVALAATGIGLVVVAVLALVSALDDQDDSLEEVNKRIDQYNDGLESSLGLIDRQTELLVERAKTAGKAETDLLRIQGAGLQRQFNAITENINKMAKERDALDATSSQWFALNASIEENISKRADLGRQINILNEQGKRAVADEAKDRIEKENEANEKIKAAREKAAQEARQRRVQGLQDIQADIENRLLFVKKGSADELKLQQDLVIAKRNVDLAGENLTAAEIRLIRAKAYKENLDLQEQFNKTATEKELQAILDRNNAELEQLNISAERKLQLQTENIAVQSQLEINAAEENATKILLIEAKKISDIRALKNAEIERELQATLEVSNRNLAIITRGNAKIVDDTSKSVDQRITALNFIADAQVSGVLEEIAANERLEQSEEDRAKNAQKLADKLVDIEQNRADKIDEINQSAKEKAIENFEAIASVAFDIANQAADLFQSIADLQSEKEQQEIESQRAQLDALVAAGAITKKEAETRAKQLEILEKQAKQRQAQRQKQIAVFNAVLAIPQSFLTGLQQGGPILGAIYAAIAAAQAAIIIARPVPKFFRGKKDTYQGPGVVADMGPELVERGGRMQLYTKPTMTYLRARDKVYTAAETRVMLHKAGAIPNITTVSAQAIDYDKMAKAMPQANVSINIEKDFISEAVANGLAKNNFYNKRYTFN